MSEAVFDRFTVIDTDTHVTEPHDVWTAREMGTFLTLVTFNTPGPHER